MNTTQLKDELKRLTVVIHSLQQTVLAHEGAIPKIELDILLEHYRKAYNLLLELGNSPAAPEPAPDRGNFPDPAWIASADTTAAAPVTIDNREPLPAKEIEIKTPHEDVHAAVDSPAKVEEEKLPVTMQPEVLTSAVEIPVISESTEIMNEAVLPQAGLQKERSREFSRSPKTITASLFDETPTVAHQFSSTATVRDRYTAASDDHSIAEKLQEQPLTDLKKSIGINEKFSFVNELFDGDLSSYNAAIDGLNTCGNLGAAMKLLSEKLAVQYGWTDDRAAFQQLKNLVTRRFSA